MISISLILSGAWLGFLPVLFAADTPVSQPVPAAVAVDAPPRVVLAQGEAKNVMGSVIESFHRHLRADEYLQAYDMFSKDLRDNQMTLIEFLEQWRALEQQAEGPMDWGFDEQAAPGDLPRLDPALCPDPFNDYDAVVAFYRCRGLRAVFFEIGLSQREGRWEICLWKFRTPVSDWQGVEAIPRKTGGKCPVKNP